MFLVKQLKPANIDLQSVVSKTLRTISHIAMLSNRTECLALRTINQITTLDKPVYKTFKKTDTVSFIFLISLLSQPSPLVSTLSSTDSPLLSPNMHMYTNHTPNLPTQTSHTPFLYRLSDQDREEGTCCLGFFMCLFILPHW